MAAKSSKAAPKAKTTSQRSVIPAGQVDAPQRRRDILIAASELFAAYGYHGVSVRDIAQRANVPIALCSYYFGKKRELFLALFEQNKLQIEERAATIKAAMEAGPKKEALERLVRAWAGPIMAVDLPAESAVFATLTVRSLWDPSEEAQEAVRSYFDPVVYASLDALATIMPDRSHEDLVWGYEWAVGTLLMYVMDGRIARISNGKTKAGDVMQMDNFISFVCAGLRSLPSQPSA